MKTKIITGLKKEILLIEFKEGYELAGSCIDAIFYYDNQMNYEDYPLSISVDGNYTLLGKPDEISEEDVIDLVHRDLNEMTDEFFCRDYKSDWADNFDLLSALQSFHSALESDIYWDVNPIPTPEIQGGHDDYGNFHGGWDDSWISAFEHAQEKTFDRNRTLIFVKN